MNLFKKRKYKAWLLDDDFLLLGKIVQKGFKYIFIPNNKGCGFDYQIIWKKDIGEILFYDIDHITRAGLSNLEKVY